MGTWAVHKALRLPRRSLIHLCFPFLFVKFCPFDRNLGQAGRGDQKAPAFQTLEMKAACIDCKSDASRWDDTLRHDVKKRALDPGEEACC